MKILFIHQNFPAQFRHLAPALVRRGDELRALTPRKGLPALWQGVQIHRYAPSRSSSKEIHPWLADLESKVIRGEACLRAATALRDEGYTPDVIVAHPGWGECLFLREVWPRARLGLYCEFFYRAEGADVGFDPEFVVPDPFKGPRMRLKNLHNDISFGVADAGLSPTAWQAASFPTPFRSKISVVHDGIDTRRLQPEASAALQLRTAAGREVTLDRHSEVVTFVNRNLEPYRGFHVFMRALPALLAERPQARVLLVGGDGVSYGRGPEGGGSWKDALVQEVRPLLRDSEWERVHFMGTLPYAQFVTVLQLSRVHVYLTYPFVLSWSLLEAMSVGCAIVASDTAPVTEVITQDETGRLVDFFDSSALAAEVSSLLGDAAARQRLGASARTLIRAQYDLETCCLPAQINWLDRLADS